MHIAWLLLTNNTVKLLLVIDTVKQPAKDWPLHHTINLSSLPSVCISSVCLCAAHSVILRANGARFRLAQTESEFKTQRSWAFIRSPDL